MVIFFSWRFWLILIATLGAFLYAAPNLYGYKPAIQISSHSKSNLPKVEYVVGLLEQDNIPFDSYKVANDSLLFQFNDVTDQLAAQSIIESKMQSVQSSIRLEPQHPNWLDKINALPMYLGLDLRGGVYFLMEVDTNKAIIDLLSRYQKDFAKNLVEQKIVSKPVVNESELSIDIDIFKNRTESTFSWLEKNYPELTFTLEQQNQSSLEKNLIIAKVSESRLSEIINSSISQNITTIRNRIDELGVSEPIVQRQGKNYIVVQLPGVQDTKRAKEILGATASLEFRAVNENLSVYNAIKSGRVLEGNELINMRLGGNPVLLKEEVIVSGNQVIHAASSISQQNNEPIVNITLDSVGGDRMLEFTQKNLGKRMGVVYLEYFRDDKGKLIAKKSVISNAVVQGVFSTRFHISGLESPAASRDLALLLRSGALAAPMDIVEERTMGPSLGKKNIERGFIALVAGLLMVLIFMPIRYKIFGVFADICLFLNLIFICAILSLFQATLTLPGIAGIVLTMGMAVDANVLIFERIKEQLKLGFSNYEAITEGFKQAFQTIFDANITTLIAAIVLFVFGTGPIKGFALTLSIGIITSMFSAIFIGRFLIDSVYKKQMNVRDIKPLSIQ